MKKRINLRNLVGFMQFTVNCLVKTFFKIYRTENNLNTIIKSWFQYQNLQDSFCVDQLNKVRIKY